ncbi:MAG: BTAD domain-containing putative transcriptional regulator [Jatrophihabitantaceae bacterium]
MAGREGAAPFRIDAALPRPRTPLVGRDDEAARALIALRGARLLTLTGPGGSGKTRLALSVAAAAAADVADRPDPQGAAPRTDAVAWIELAGIAEAGLVAESVRAGLGVAESARLSPVEAISEAIRGAGVLLCLDNCEHVVTAVAELVDRLLDACPGLRVLSTSREPLAVEGEAVWPVSPLDVPRGEVGTASEVRATGSGRLFELRARAVSPTFELTDADAGAVARLCRRTGGLPLAIELAAARVRLLSVAQIANGMDDVARLHAGPSRTAPRRQQSLQATLDWSHELLSEPERIVFRRLGVFPGSFALDAAQAVASTETVAVDEVLDVLGHLVDRSLLTPQRWGEQVRYRLLAPIRSYARAQLASAGELDAAAAAHLTHYTDLAERIEPLLTGPRQTAELDRLELEGNNLRVALAFAAGCRPPSALGLRMATSLWRLCAMRGHYREGRRWLDWAATVEMDAPAALRAKALLVSGSLAHLQCDYPAAVRRLEAALQRYRDLQDPGGVASALQVLGSVARERGRYARAESLHRESLQLADAEGDQLRIAQCHGYLGFAGWLQGNWQAATDECRQALAAFRRLGDGEGTAWSLLSLGIVAQYRGELGTAAELLGQTRELSERLGYREGLAWTAHQLGALALRREESSAAPLLLDALAAHRALGDSWRSASVLEDLAGVAQLGGDDRRAVALLAAATGLRTEIGTEMPPCERPDHDRVEAALRARLSAEDFARAWAHGHTATLDDLIAHPAADEPVAVAPTPRVTRPVAHAAAPGQLRIRALGEATVCHGERQLTQGDWGYGKPRELLFLLVSSPPRSKAEVGHALWPNLSGSQLRNAFHTALRDLRRALGDPGWVVFAGGRYSIERAREHWCDLEIFEEALAAARQARPAPTALPHLQRAISAYGGDFGAGLPDTEWVQVRRAQLAQAFATVLGSAGRLLASAGRIPEAVEIYRRAVRHDPLDEAAHRRLMSALIHTGQAAQAAQVYEQLTGRLRDELGVAPAPETSAVYHRLERAG